MTFISGRIGHSQLRYNKFRSAFYLENFANFFHLSVEERSPNQNKLHLKDHIMYLAAKNIIL
jgi:hypothetical protein